MPSLNHTQSLHNLFNNPRAYGSAMIVALIDSYGGEALNWLPQVIRAETTRDYGVKWNESTFSRLMAGMIIVTTDRFYNSLPDFVELCQILAGESTTPGIFSPASVADCAWGITESLLLYPPDIDDPEPFNEDIVAYISAVLAEEGLITAPSILRFALKNNTIKGNVDASYSDDVEMFSAIYKTEASKTSDIDHMIKVNLIELITQIEALNLKNGSTKDVAKKMMQKLNETPVEGAPLSE